MHPDGAAAPIAGVELIVTGGIAADVGDEIARALSLRVAFPCSIYRRRPPPLVPRLRDRDQADADAFLAVLERLPRPPGRVVVGLTAQDLGHPLFTYFFGRARHDGGAAVVSLARLSPAFYGLPEDAGLTVRRAVLTILHELGHVAGLVHCRAAACLMHFTSDVEALDARGRTFCPACTARLPPGLTKGHDRVQPGP